MGTTTIEQENVDETRPRIWGWMLVVLPLLSASLAFLHPHLSGHGIAAVLAEMRDRAAFDALVHGLLLALALPLFAALAVFSWRLGILRPTVLVAISAYGLGLIAMVGAAAINGFAVGIFAWRYDPLPVGQEAALAAGINAMGSVAAAWAAIGAVAMSAAILLWSVRLLMLGGRARGVAIGGLLIGGGTAALVATGTMVLNVHGFIAMEASQALWTVAIGVLMLRRAL